MCGPSNEDVLVSVPDPETEADSEAELDVTEVWRVEGSCTTSTSRLVTSRTLAGLLLSRPLDEQRDCDRGPDGDCMGARCTIPVCEKLLRGSEESEARVGSRVEAVVTSAKASAATSDSWGGRRGLYTSSPAEESKSSGLYSTGSPAGPSVKNVFTPPKDEDGNMVAVVELATNVRGRNGSSPAMKSLKFGSWCFLRFDLDGKEIWVDSLPCPDKSEYWGAGLTTTRSG